MLQNGSAVSDVGGSEVEHTEKDKKEKKDQKEKKEKKGKKEKKEKKRKIESNGTDDNSSSLAVDKKHKKPDHDVSEHKPSKKPKEAASEDTNGHAADSEEVVAAEEDDEVLGAPTTSDPDQLPGDPTHPPLTQHHISSATIATLNKKKGIYRLFPIQAATYEHIFSGHDLVGRARTGTGKTFSFAIPVLERLIAADLSAAGDKGSPRLPIGRTPRVLCMCPTRELAIQVCADFTLLSQHLVTLCVYGGSPYPPQERALYSGVDVVVGTPGRIKDHVDSNKLKLHSIEYVILDEADEMLNIGFADAIEAILAHVPADRPHQTLLFSATLPPWVKGVARKYLRPDHKTVDLVSTQTAKIPTEVRHLAVSCHFRERSAVLADIVKVYGQKGRTIVFCNTKAEAHEFATGSSLRGECETLHGDIAQSQREVTLSNFRAGKFSVLVATDVAARGLDISGVDLIIQTQPPKDTDTYIHRSGRTGRAGRTGTVITFFMKRDQALLQQLEHRIGIKFERIGVPQPEDIVRASADAAHQSIEAVSDAVLPYFAETAKLLIADKGAEEALAAALAVITGYTQQFKPRSLLGSLEGYTTLQVTSQREIYSPTYVLGMLRPYLPADAMTQIRDIALTADGRGAVIDVPADAAAVFLSTRPQSRFQTWDTCKALPALKERPLVAERGGGGGGGRADGGGRFSRGRGAAGGRKYRGGRFH